MRPPAWVAEFTSTGPPGRTVSWQSGQNSSTQMEVPRSSIVWTAPLSAQWVFRPRSVKKSDSPWLPWSGSISMATAERSMNRPSIRVQPSGPLKTVTSCRPGMARWSIETEATAWVSSVTSTQLTKTPSPKSAQVTPSWKFVLKPSISMKMVSPRRTLSGVMVTPPVCTRKPSSLSRVWTTSRSPSG